MQLNRDRLHRTKDVRRRWGSQFSNDKRNNPPYFYMIGKANRAQPGVFLKYENQE